MSSESTDRKIDILLLDISAERKSEGLLDELWTLGSAE